MVTTTGELRLTPGMSPRLTLFRFNPKSRRVPHLHTYRSKFTYLNNTFSIASLLSRFAAGCLLETK